MQRSAIKFAKFYDRAITNDPLTTKCITAAVLSVVGDSLAQTISHYRSEKTLATFTLDKARTLTFFVVGGAISAPLCHYWYNWLDTVPKLAMQYKPFANLGKWGSLGLKLCCDQVSSSSSSSSGSSSGSSSSSSSMLLISNFIYIIIFLFYFLYDIIHSYITL
jgi:predicted PurR-regulated permease PerM